ncbi:MULTISPECIES: ABC transporter ATP-binding protein [unclassified Nocardioides]|uniref:ABC transporter ATP-binding protein n=1 Tax=unclassified Nocardioides TaxID=2615069 RepID=UPI00360791A7
MSPTKTLGPAVLEARGLTVRYGDTVAVDAVDLAIEPGSRTAVMGPSGSGKSSLVHALAGIVRPDAGEVWFEDERLDLLGEAARSRRRLARMGMVFQFGDLVPELTLVENVMLPLQVLGHKARPARERALTVLDALGVADLADRRTGAVSGGQAQRAAVARALVHHPSVVLADEPTGALDSLTAERVLDTMVEVTRQMGAALVVVTHDHVVASHLDDLVVVRDGRVGVGAPA